MKKLSLLSLIVGGLFSLAAIGAAERKEINYDDFFEAARLGNVGKVEEMIQAGAQVDYQNEYGLNALMFAAFEGQRAVVDLLLRSGAAAAIDHQDKTGWTALMYAAYSDRSGRVELMKTLLLAGANPSIKNHKNQTAFDIAKAKGKEGEYDQAVSSAKDMQERKKVVTLLLEEREKSPDSPFYKEKLPREILQEIMVRSGLIKSEQERKQKQ